MRGSTDDGDFDGRRTAVNGEIGFDYGSFVFESVCEILEFLALVYSHRIFLDDFKVGERG